MDIYAQNSLLVLFKKSKNLKKHKFSSKSETLGLKDLIYTTKGVNINITIDIFYLYFPTINPDAESQVMFNG